jgi:NAD(P)-dependent dehydrogenase (short-subunit alcohol dehydrogenase family)
MAAEFLEKGWRVVGAVRAGTGRTKLHDLAEASEGRLEIETLDINEPEQITSSAMAGDGFPTPAR